MTRTRCFYFLALATVFSGLIFPARPAFPYKITTTTPFVNLPRPSDDPRWAEAFAHWDKRAETDDVLAAINIFEELAKDNPDKSAPRLWLCRSYYLAALRIRRDRKELAEKAIAAGEKGQSMSPGDDNIRYWRFAAIILHRDLTEDELKEIREFGKKYSHLSFLPNIDDPLWEEALQHYEKRDSRDEIMKAIEIFEKFEKENPDRIEPKLWLCQCYYILERFEDTDEGKAKWIKIGIDYGKKAMALEPRNPEANYLTAVCLGEYGLATSYVFIARNALDIGRQIVMVVEEDPQYNFGAFSRYIAAAIGEVGPLVIKIAGILGFPQDLIERLTTFAVNYEPNFLVNHYDLSRMMIAMGRMDEAKSTLEYIINADPTALKGYEPDNRDTQKKAKLLLDENFK